LAGRSRAGGGVPGSRGRGCSVRPPHGRPAEPGARPSARLRRLLGILVVAVAVAVVASVLAAR